MRCSREWACSWRNTRHLLRLTELTIVVARTVKASIDAFRGTWQWIVAIHRLLWDLLLRSHRRVLLIADVGPSLGGLRRETENMVVEVFLVVDALHNVAETARWGTLVLEWTHAETVAKQQTLRQTDILGELHAQ